MMSLTANNSRPFIILGSGGHAKVVISMLKRLDYKVLGVCDPRFSTHAGDLWHGVPILGDDEKLKIIQAMKYFWPLL